MFPAFSARLFCVASMQRLLFGFALKLEAVLRAGFWATLDLCSVFKDTRACFAFRKFSL